MDGYICTTGPNQLGYFSRKYRGMPPTEQAAVGTVMNGSKKQEVSANVYETASRKVEQNTDIM